MNVAATASSSASTGSIVLGFIILISIVVGIRLVVTYASRGAVRGIDAAARRARQAKEERDRRNF